MEFSNESRYWYQYGPEPASLTDFAGRVLFEVPHRIFIGRKPTHCWNWKRYHPYPQSFDGNPIDGDPQSFSPRDLEDFSGYTLRNIVEFLYMESRFGLQKTRVIQPNLAALDPERELKYWQYGWSPDNQAFLDLCAVTILPQEAVKVLIPRNPIRLHGVGNDGQEVPLIISEEVFRWDKQFSGLPLF